MSYSSRLTRTRILKCAKQEFMEQGYQNANMRDIAKSAKVTTGAMYNHFAHKSVLFDALVQKPAEEMLMQFKKIHQQMAEKLPSMSGEMMDQGAGEGADWMLEYIYQHLDAFKLIFCHSNGTRWSSYLEDLITIEQNGYRIYCDALGLDDIVVDDLFLHITAASGFQYLVEFVSHEIPYEQACAVMGNVKRYGIAGWREILGL